MIRLLKKNITTFTLLYSVLFLVASKDIFAENNISLQDDLCQEKEQFFLGASKGDTLSLYNSGVLYFNGECVEKNLELAYELFAHAANNGYDKALHTVAVMLHSGVGTQKNLVKANEIFTELLRKEFHLAKKYACAMQEFKDSRIKSFPPLSALQTYKGCKSGR